MREDYVVLASILRNYDTLYTLTEKRMPPAAAAAF
jgi:hypothetical protein